MSLFDGTEENGSLKEDDESEKRIDLIWKMVRKQQEVL